MIAGHIVMLTSIRNCRAPGVTFRALLTEDGAERLELVRVQGRPNLALMEAHNLVTMDGIRARK
jgi:hypothetical protein